MNTEATRKGVGISWKKGIRELVFCRPLLYDADGIPNIGHEYRRRGFVDEAGKSGCRYTVIYGRDYLTQALDYICSAKAMSKPAFLFGDTFAGGFDKCLWTERLSCSQWLWRLWDMIKVGLYQILRPSLRLWTIMWNRWAMRLRTCCFWYMIEGKEGSHDIRIPSPLWKGQTLWKNKINGRKTPDCVLMWTGASFRFSYEQCKDTCKSDNFEHPGYKGKSGENVAIFTWKIEFEERKYTKIH